MSFVIDQNCSSWECFEVNTAETLFWKRVPFVFKPLDREDVREEFTVRILRGVTKNNHNLRVLRIHVSTEADLMFLHTLEVTEEDFQGLKAEQGILVDFSHFPTKLITLLEKCASACNDEFQAELTSCGMESCLRIVETNDFKKLPHVSLKFRPGSDQAVKSFLAFRLSEMEQEQQKLRTQLTASQLECEQLNVELKDKDKNWKEIQEKYERKRLETSADSKKIKLEAEERLTEAKASLKVTLEKEKRDMEEKLTEQITTLTVRNHELEEENKKLRDDRYAFDKKNSELLQRLATCEGQLSCVNKECVELRDANHTLIADKHQLQVDLSQAQAEMRALNEKVLSCDERIDLQNHRIKELDASRAQTEQHCEELRVALSTQTESAKARSNELKEREFVIQKLAGDLHVTKEKHCNMRAIMSRQEDVISYQKQQLAKSIEEKDITGRHAAALQRENEAMKSEMDELKLKLKERADELRRNEEMIEWFNKQLNDSGLHHHHHQQQQHQGSLKFRSARTRSFVSPFDRVRTGNQSILNNPFPISKSFSSEVDVLSSPHEQV